MSEEAAIYRLDIAEAEAQGRMLAKALSEQDNLVAQLRERVRELEDGIVLHRRHLEHDACEHDDRLWAMVERLWS